VLVAVTVASDHMAFKRLVHQTLWQIHHVIKTYYCHRDCSPCLLEVLEKLSNIAPQPSDLNLKSPESFFGSVTCG